MPMMMPPPMGAATPPPMQMGAPPGGLPGGAPQGLPATPGGPAGGMTPGGGLAAAMVGGMNEAGGDLDLFQRVAKMATDNPMWVLLFAGMGLREALEKSGKYESKPHRSNAELGVPAPAGGAPAPGGPPSGGGGPSPMMGGPGR